MLLERARVAARRRRSRSPSRSRRSPPRCRPAASPRTPPGSRSRVGCNNTCTFCIVPALRGKEKDRRPGDILAEIEALVAEGVIEITLLGQNVNAYGVDFGDREAFGKLLRACGEIEGLERVRFTSPHPRDFTDDVIAAMAETPNVMPQLHMPLQSGSDRVLKAMRRSYRQERYLGIIEKVRAAMPDAAITTDIIVGFPGETEEDFEQTLDVVAQARFARRLHLPVLQAPRHPGRRHGRPDPQGGRPGPLRAAGRRSRGDLLGREQEAGRPHASRSWSPRARAARTPPPTGSPAARPTTGWSTSPRPGGDESAPATWSPSRSPTPPRTTSSPTRPAAVRRTRGGDAWEARTGRRTPQGVGLGMPTVGAPGTPCRTPGLPLSSGGSYLCASL